MSVTKNKKNKIDQRKPCLSYKKKTFISFFPKSVRMQSPLVVPSLTSCHTVIALQKSK